MPQKADPSGLFQGELPKAVLIQCPVCGYGLNKPPVDFTFCPSCGTEFGYHDFDHSFQELRSQWIESGMPWWSPVRPKPAAWNPTDQLDSLIANEKELAAAIRPFEYVAQKSGSFPESKPDSFKIQWGSGFRKGLIQNSFHRYPEGIAGRA